MCNRRIHRILIYALYIVNIYKKIIYIIFRTIFLIKSLRKKIYENTTLFRDFLFLIDYIFVIIELLLYRRDYLYLVSEYINFEPNRLLSRLKCFTP